MNTIRHLFCIMAGSFLASCAPIQDVSQSREVLWQEFGHQSIDALLMKWGVPNSETQMTDGSRLATYEYSTVYEAGGNYERSSHCKASFLAKAPSYRIEDVALVGNARECGMLSQGRIGQHRIPAVATPRVYDPLPYQRYRF
jgi:hypothetical protein